MYELENALDDFLSYLSVERGSSRRTVEAYHRDLEAYLRFLEEHEVEEPADITRDKVAAFERSLTTQGYSAATIRRRVAAVRGYHKFMVREGITTNNPADSIDLPKLAERLPDVLSVEEVSTMLEAFSDETPAGLRDRAILEVLYGCGLRVSEACGLDVERVYFDEGLLRVFGKGAKERLVPLSGQAYASLKRYMEQGRPFLSMACEHPDPDALAAVFLNQRGRRMSRQSYFNLLRKAGRVIGRFDLHPHTLRHSYATHMLKGGADLAVLQELLGHADMSTLQVYTHLDTAHLHEEYDFAHPRDKMN